MQSKVDSVDAYAYYEANGRNYVETAKFFNVDEKTIRRAVDKVRGTPTIVKTKDFEIASLRGQVSVLQKQALSDELVRKEILKLADAPVDVPPWLTQKPKKHTKHLAGVPTFFASDWHWGERVRQSEIGGVNEYDITIAKERARTFINVGIELLRDHMPHSQYEGCVFALGGDMLSGDIHDELSQTNEVETMPALLDVLGVLTGCIERLADEFGRVFVPCVTGNHGRNTRKPRAKRRNHTNFDWLLYNVLAQRFSSDSRVSFLIPEGPDAYYRIYGTRYLLTHGDQFRGGDGMIGALGPISRGDKKKRGRNVETNQSFDVMLLGHWHQYIHLSRFIVNGTLKGYDEYANANNFDVEPAQQALWVTHPDHGITYRMPVYVQRRGKAERAEWVSVGRTLH